MATRNETKKETKKNLLRPSEDWGVEPQTEQRVIELAKLITEGYSRKDIQAYCKENYGVGERQQRSYYGAAVRYLLPENAEDYRNGLLQANIDRLEHIISQTMSGQNYRDALTAIKEMNNLLQPKNNVTIAKKGETEIIQISFD